MNLCISVGHAHPAVTEAVKEQVDRLTHCTTMFHHPVPAHFAEELASTMPAGEDWVVHFTNSGTEAIDLAMMLARASTENSDIISLRNSYHGATYGAQAVTGVQNFRYNIGQLSNITFVAEPNEYRGIFGGDTQAYLGEIDRTIACTTSGSLAGMIIEPVQGYGGIVIMPDGYLKGAFERVNETLFSPLPHARAEITAWKEGYNRQRPHSSLGNITPNEFAMKWLWKNRLHRARLKTKDSPKSRRKLGSQVNSRAALVQLL